MARGQRCPSCGRLTFQVFGQVRRCSDAECAAVGWLGEGPTDIPARGRKCGFCGVGTMKTVGELASGALLHRCFTCSAVYFTESN